MRSRQNGLLVATALAGVILAGSTRCVEGAVVVVDAAGGGAFTTVQPAVDAALDGDILLIRAGSYPGFDIVDKALTVVSDPAVPPEACQLGRVRVANLSLTRTVVLSRLRLGGSATGPADADGCALLVESCTGPVRLQRLIGTGAGGTATHSAGYAGAVIRASANVQTMTSTFTGGAGRGSDCAAPNAGGAGGTGLRVESGAFNGNSGVFTGGAGGNACHLAGAGGHGVHVLSGVVVLHALKTAGGRGGDALEPSNPAAALAGDGGDAVVTDTGGTTTLVSVQGSAGLGGANNFGQHGASGALVAGTGTANIPPWPGRTLAVTTVAQEGNAANLLFEGPPGDTVLLFLSATAGPPVPGPQDVPYVLGVPIGPIVIGVMPASSQLVVPLLAPALPPGLLGAAVHLQAALVGSTGAGWSGPVHTTILDASF